MKRFMSYILFLCVVIAIYLPKLNGQISQKLIQTNGPKGGKFKKVLAFNKGWKDIDAGFEHSAAINFDGTLWAWGNNINGQIGDNTFISKNKPTLIDTSRFWQIIKTGGNHTIALQYKAFADDLEGKNKFIGVYSWGWNGYGQLGIGYPPEDKNVVTKISYFENVFKYAQVEDLKKIRIAVGAEHSMLLDHTGKLHVWGNGAKGQLGIDLGPKTLSYNILEMSGNNWKEIASGDYHNLAIKTDGTLWAWGSNEKGQLGDNSQINRNLPIQIGNDKDWKFISCGTDHSIAIKNDGTIWGWGNNIYYQLGDSSTNQIQITPKKLNKDKWIYVDCGVYLTVAQHENGKFYSWGANNLGQLGDGTTKYRNIPSDIKNQEYFNKVVAGGNFMLGLEKKGELLSWGDNVNGKLGITKEYDSIPNSVDKGSTIVFALPHSSNNNSIYKSTDNGNNWEALVINKIENASPYSNYGKDLKQEFNKLILAENSRILKSTNLGINWETAVNMNRIVSLDNYDIYKNIRVASDFKAIEVSIDNGSSFRDISNFAVGDNFNVIALQKYNGIELFNGGVKYEQDGRRFTYSLDTGKTWKSISYILYNYPNEYPSEFTSMYPTKDRKSFLACAFTNEYNSSVYEYLTDGSMNYLGRIGTKVNDIIFRDTTFFGTDKGVQIYTRKAERPFKLAEFRSITDTNYNFNVSCFSLNESDGVLYTATNGQGILRNKTFDSNWEQLNLKNQNILSFASYGNVLFTLTDQGGIYSSKDAGNSWKLYNTKGVNFNAFSKFSLFKDKIFFNSNYQIFTLSNDNWIMYKDNTIDSAIWGSGIIIDTKYDNNFEYYFIGNNSLTNNTILEAHKLVRINIFDSIPEVLSVPTKDYLNTFLFYNNLYYAGNGLLYKSVNKGQTWAIINNVNKIANIDIYEKIIVVASTIIGDSSIMTSIDEGLTWKYIGKGFPLSLSKPIVKIIGSTIYSYVNNELWYSPINEPKWRKLVDSTTCKVTQLHNHNGFMFVGTEFNSVWKIQLSPVLIFPSDSSNQVDLSPKYTWNSVQGAKEYEFQLSDTSDFTKIVYNQKLIDTSILPNYTLNKASRYFWRVRVKNTEDLWSGWSYNNVFATKFPNLSISYSPASNSINRSVVQAFALVDSERKSFWKYQVQFASDKNFNDILINNFYDSVFFYIELKKGTQYYYRLRQYDPNIGFGGGWLPSNTNNYIKTAPDQIYFSPIRDGFKFTNSYGTFWNPNHYNQFDYSIYPSIKNTPKNTFPSYHDFISAFGWQEIYRQCCCKRKFIIFGPRTCKNIFQYNTITKWRSIIGSWGGSCSGFSVLALQNYKNNIKPYNIDLNFNDNLQRQINQRQQYQYSRSLQKLNTWISPNRLGDFLKNRFSSSNKLIHPELCFFWGNSGHSVVPYMVTSGISNNRSVDTIWVYNNWSGFNLKNPKEVNHLIIVDKLNNTWKLLTYNSYWNDYLVQVVGYEDFEIVNAASYPSIPELKIEKKDNSILSFKKRGDFILENDSNSITSIFVSNNKNTSILDQNGRKLHLDSINQSEIPNASLLKTFGGIKDISNLKILGALILPSDSNSIYTIEKNTTNVNDTNNIKVFGLGYDAEITWNAKLLNKPLVVYISDSTNGIQIQSKTISENVTIEVYKEDLIKNYQKSIKINNTSLSQNEDFKAGFSADASEFVITNNGSDKKYDVTVDLGIEIDLKNIQFNSRETHIYRLEEPKSDDDTTKLIVKIDRSGSGKKDTTITYDGSLDTVNSVSVWHNKSDVQMSSLELYPNPVINDLVIKLELNTHYMVSLEIYDINGKFVKSIINKEKDQGIHYIYTDLSDLVSGIYLMKCSFGNKEITKQFIIHK